MNDPLSLRIRALVRKELTRQQSEIKRQIKDLAKLSEDLENLADSLDISLDATAASNENTLPIRVSAFDNPAVPFEAGYLEICRDADGSAAIWLDNQKPFRLSCGLTDLLVHLASAKVAPDGLPAWTSRLALREWLERQSGRSHDSKYVNHRVHVLRKRLRDAGVKRHVIHTDPRLGVRLALRNGASGLVVRGGQRAG